MQSPIANFFIALVAYLKQRCPEIRFIDQDIGQLDFYKDRPAVSWPCLLLDVGDFDFTNFSELLQQGDGQIIFRLGFTPFSSANSLVPDLVQLKALAFYNIEFKLHQALQGWSPPNGNYGNLIRVSAITEKRDDPYRVREIRYRLAFEDYSTKRGSQLHTATPDIGVGIGGDNTGDFNTDFNDDFSGE